MKKSFGKSRGQIAVVYAVAIAGLLAAAALGTDVVAMYVDWQQAQKVADAAAIAGANYLGGGVTYADPTTGTAYPTSSGCTGEQAGSTPEAVATQVACTYAVKNGMAPGTKADGSVVAVTINPITNTTPEKLQVTIQNSSLPYLFGNAFGARTYSVAASATAAAPGQVNTVLGSTSNTTDQGLFPIGLQCAAPCAAGSLIAGQNVAFGSKFLSASLNSSTGGCGGACGNWDWIGPDGKGSSSIGGDITNGATTPYAVSPNGACGTNAVGASYCIDSATGNKSNSGPISKALSARLASCPSIADPCANGGNPNDIPAGDPCLVIMPVVDFTGVTGSKPMPIEQFAEVYLEPDSTATNLDGCFISTVPGNTLTVTTTTTTTTTQSTGLTSPPTLTN
jgi:hypothetical protein